MKKLFKLAAILSGIFIIIMVLNTIVDILFDLNKTYFTLNNNDDEEALFQ